MLKCLLLCFDVDYVLLLHCPKRMDVLYVREMFIMIKNVGRNVLCILFQNEFHFLGSTAPKPARGVWLAQALLVPAVPAPTFLEQESSESGPGVGCGWLSKLGNVLVITFYCCLHLSFQSFFSSACVSPPQSLTSFWLPI